MVLPLMYYNVLHNWICQQNQFHGKECERMLKDIAKEQSYRIFTFETIFLTINEIL